MIATAQEVGDGVFEGFVAGETGGLGGAYGGRGVPHECPEGERGVCFDGGVVPVWVWDDGGFGDGGGEGEAAVGEEVGVDEGGAAGVLVSFGCIEGDKGGGGWVLGCTLGKSHIMTDAEGGR